MSAWGAVLHQMRWDLLRVRWWILGASAMMVAQLLLSRMSKSDVAAVSIGLVSMVYMVLIGVVSTQSDSAIQPAAFFRGRPMPWWVMPVAKVGALFVAIALPALLIGTASLTEFEETWRERIGHIGAILLGVGLIVFAGFTYGAVTRGIADIGVLVIASYLVNLAATSVLRAIKWPGAPWLSWLVIAATLYLSLDVYRRVWKPRAALLGMIALSLVNVIASTKFIESRTEGRIPPPRDSVRIVIDSVNTERPHIVRVAFTVEAPSTIDGLQFPSSFASVGQRSTLFGIDRLNHASPVLIEGEMSERGKLTVSDPYRSHYTEFTKRSHGGGRGSGNGDLHFDRVGPGGIRKARAVAIVAMWDSTPLPGAEVRLNGTATAFSARVESRLPLEQDQKSRDGTAHWAIRKELDDGRPAWSFVRTALGVLETKAAPQQSLSGIGRYSTRLIEKGQPLSTGVSSSGARSSLGVIVVPGLVRQVESFRFDMWTLDEHPKDTISLLRIEAIKQVGFSARDTIRLARGGLK